MRTFLVQIELETVEFRVEAKTKAEAKKKALAKLKQKDPTRLIRTSWPEHRKEISVDEL